MLEIIKLTETNFNMSSDIFVIKTSSVPYKTHIQISRITTYIRLINEGQINFMNDEINQYKIKV